jgi:hypothetical protein
MEKDLVTGSYPCPTISVGASGASFDAAGSDKNEGAGPVEVDWVLQGSTLSSKFAETLRELFWIYGAPPLVVRSLGANLRCLVSSNDETVFFSRAKKFCEFFSAKLLGTSCQSIPVFGHLKTWVQSRLFRSGKFEKRVAFSEAIFKAKAVMGHATDYATWKSLVAHRRNVEDSVPNDSTVDEIFDAVEPVLDHIMAGARSQFEVFLPTSPAASTGSTDSKRRVQGKAGRLLRTFHGCYETHPDLTILQWDCRKQEPLRLPVESSGDTPGSRYDHSPDPHESGADLGVLLEEPAVTRQWFMETDGTASFELKADYPRSQMEWAAHVLEEALLDVESGRSRDVTVTAVCESAAKVRTVTSGASAPAYVVREWQRVMMGEMKKLPCFPSMRGVITALEVTKLLEGSELAGSSDFKGATDLLNPNLTNRILGRLVDGFVAPSIVMDDNADKVLHYPWEPLGFEVGAKDRVGVPYLQLPTGEKVSLLWDKFRGPVRRVRVPPDSVVRCQVTSTMSVWYPVRVYFDTPSGDVVIPLPGSYPSAVKTCGQLMGQTTSFVLLCLVNVGCSLAALLRVDWVRDSSRWWWYALEFFIINGDDRLARTSRELERQFWLIASPIGLQRSPGKSHEHPDFACINSQVYVRSRASSHRGVEIWKRVAVMRSGLMFGIKKLKQDEFRPSLVVSALFESVPHWVEPRAIACFLRQWGPTLKAELDGRNLFLPVALNGMGQVAPPSWGWSVTAGQLAVAHRLMTTQPALDFSWGPQWPSVNVPVACANPWDVPTAPWDAGSIEHELAIFNKRHGFRLLREVDRSDVERVCCNKKDHFGRESSVHQCGFCPNGSWQTPQVRDDPYGDLGWDAPKKAGAPRYLCTCHPHVLWLTSGPPPQVWISASELKACARPTHVSGLLRPETGGERARPRRIETWSGRRLPVSLHGGADFMAAQAAAGRFLLPCGGEL